MVWFTSLVESAGTTILNEDGTEASLEQVPTERALEVIQRLSTSLAVDPSLRPPGRTRAAWRGSRAPRPS